MKCEMEKVSLDMGPLVFESSCLDGTVSLASTPHTTAPCSCPQKSRRGQPIGMSEIQSTWSKLNCFHPFPLPSVQKVQTSQHDSCLAPPCLPSPFCPVSSHTRVLSFPKHRSLLAERLWNVLLSLTGTLSPTPRLAPRKPALTPWP